MFTAQRASTESAGGIREAHQRRSNWTPVWFLAPIFIIVLLFRVAAMFYGAWLSLTRWNGIASPQFVGLQNYRELFHDPAVLTSLRNNVTICLALLVGMIAPLLIALALYSKIWGWRIFRIIFFIPVALSPLVIGEYWSAFLSDGGPLSAILRGVGLHSLSHTLWLVNSSTDIPVISLVLLWSTFGFGVVLFMAGLAGIDPSLYEAARIDGANWLRMHWRITVPGLMPVIMFWGIQVLIFSFTNLFAFIFALTGGGPGYSTSVIEFQMYQGAFLTGEIGYASAVGVFILIIVLIMVTLAMWATSRRVEER